MTSGTLTYTKIKDTVENITDKLTLFTNNQAFEMIGETAATLQELKTINEATTATITLNEATKIAPFSGSLTDILAALDGVVGYKGDIKITSESAITLADLKLLNEATEGTITLNDATNMAGFSGSAVELATALDGSSGLTQKMTITGDDAATLQELKTINDATSGAVVLNDATKIALFEGSLTDLQAALDGITDYAGNITITGSQAIPIAELGSVSTLTTGTVAYSAEAIAAGYSGSALELVTALAEVTTFTQKLTITGETAATLEQLRAINDKSTGEIITSGATKTAPYSGSITDILAALEGVKEYSGEITITGESVVTLAQIKLLNAATSGTIILNDATKNAGFSGSVEDLLLVLDGVSGLSQNITITGGTAATLEQVKLINGKTTGTITINEATKTADFAGTAADLLTALDTVVGYKGALTVTDGVSVAQLALLSAATTPSVAYNKIVDTAQNAADNLALFSSNKAFEMIGETAATLEQLKAINNVTDGTITINAATKTTPFSGSAADLAAALEGISGYTGDVTITGDTAATLAELKAINTATSGTFTLNSATNESAYTASSTDLLLAFDGITSLTGALTVSAAVTATHLNTIAGITTGVLKANLADTTLTAGVVDLFDNLTKADVITLSSGKVNATILLALNEKTSLVTSNIWQITELATTTDVVQVVTAALALQPNAMVDITGALSATQINELDAATTAIIKASYAAPDLTELLSLSNVNDNNNINISIVSDDSFKELTAANLIAIESFSKDSVDYRTSTTKITGSVEELAYVAQLSVSPKKLFLSNQVEIITTGTQAEASYLNAINWLSDKDINALSVTKISGESSEFLSMIVSTGVVNGGITLKADVGIHITDGVAIEDLAEVLALISQLTITGSLTYTIEDSVANILTNTGGYVTSGVSVIVDDAISMAQISTLKGQGVLLTYETIADTAANAVANIAMFDNNQDFEMTGATAATLAQLKTINNKTKGDIELNEATLTTPFSGSAADLIEALDAIEYEGNITVTGAAPTSLQDLAEIYNLTDGAVTFSTSIATTPYTGTGEELLSVVPKITDYAGKITLEAYVNEDTGYKLLDAYDIVKLSTYGKVHVVQPIDAIEGSVSYLTQLKNLPSDKFTPLGTENILVKNSGGFLTQDNFNDLTSFTSGSIDVGGTNGIRLEGLSLDLSGFSQLSGLGGKAITMQSNNNADSLSLTAQDLFAASDKVGNLSFTVRGDANDTVTLSGWIKNGNTNSYTTTGNFDGMFGDETYTVNVINVAVVIA